jgi:hypothetical protein
MKQYKVINRSVSAAQFFGVEFRAEIIDGSYVGVAQVPEEKVEWFRERDHVFEIGEATDVPDPPKPTELSPEAKAATADLHIKLAAQEVALKTAETVAGNAVADLQGHLDQIAALVGADEPVMDSIAAAITKLRASSMSSSKK